jgi:hypothetical protein
MQRRLTIAEESHLRAAWSVLSRITDPCKEILGIQRSIWEMTSHNTTDGLPYVEPPLTDEDARQRPWVMVRDNDCQEWKGPRKLAAKVGFYYVFNGADLVLTSWRYCRRATPEEIAAAGLEVTE